MAKSDVIEIEGKVVDALPNAMFLVELPNPGILKALLGEPKVIELCLASSDTEAKVR